MGLDAVTPCGPEASQNLRDGVVLDWGRSIRRMLWFFSPNRGQRLSRFRRLASLHPHFLNGSPLTCGRAFRYCCDDGPHALKQARREDVEQVNGRSGRDPFVVVMSACPPGMCSSMPDGVQQPDRRDHVPSVAQLQDGGGEFVAAPEVAGEAASAAESSAACSTVSVGGMSPNGEYRPCRSWWGRGSGRETRWVGLGRGHVAESANRSHHRKDASSWVRGMRRRSGGGGWRSRSWRRVRHESDQVPQPGSQRRAVGWSMWVAGGVMFRRRPDHRG